MGRWPDATAGAAQRLGHARQIAASRYGDTVAQIFRAASERTRLGGKQDVRVDVKTLGTTVMRSMMVYLRQEEGAWRLTLEDFLNKPEDALSGLRAPW